MMNDEECYCFYSTWYQVCTVFLVPGIELIVEAHYIHTEGTFKTFLNIGSLKVRLNNYSIPTRTV